MSDDVVELSTGTVSRGAVDQLFEIRRIRGRPDATLNGTLPIERPGAVTSAQGGRLLWLRPGAWLAVVTDAALATSLAEGSGGTWWCFEVTAARTAFRFAGADPWAMLSLAGPVQDAFAGLRTYEGRTCSRLRLAQVPVVVECAVEEGRPVFTAWVEAPMADWWWQAQAALEANR